MSAGELDPASWIGLADMREGERRLLDAWEGFGSGAEEYRELDDERVLVLTYRRGRGKRSGLELEQLGATGADLFHVRAGKVTKLVLYGNRERALADLGLARRTSPGLVVASALVGKEGTRSAFAAASAMGELQASALRCARRSLPPGAVVGGAGRRRIARPEP
ncbi:MAG TPA: hypothetical protein VKG38_12765 [Solirubrobacteraceae bacterium]|nr:hypothetical protein [Solirubrobacteraceae bacterium]